MSSARQRLSAGRTPAVACAGEILLRFWFRLGNSLTMMLAPFWVREGNNTTCPSLTVCPPYCAHTCIFGRGGVHPFVCFHSGDLCYSLDCSDWACECPCANFCYSSAPLHSGQSKGCMGFHENMRPPVRTRTPQSCGLPANAVYIAPD